MLNLSLPFYSLWVAVSTVLLWKQQSSGCLQLILFGFHGGIAMASSKRDTIAFFSLIILNQQGFGKSEGKMLGFVL